MRRFSTITRLKRCLFRNCPFSGSRFSSFLTAQGVFATSLVAHSFAQPHDTKRRMLLFDSSALCCLPASFSWPFIVIFLWFIFLFIDLSARIRIWRWSTSYSKWAVKSNLQFWVLTKKLSIFHQDRSDDHPNIKMTHKGFYQGNCLVSDSFCWWHRRRTAALVAKFLVLKHVRRTLQQLAMSGLFTCTPSDDIYRAQEEVNSPGQSSFFISYPFTKLLKYQWLLRPKSVKFVPRMV